MAYSIIFAPLAKRQFAKLPQQVKLQISHVVSALTDNPRPHGIKKLTGQDNSYRIRSGNYRVVYEIQDKQLVILVVMVGHRRDIYKH